MRVNLFTFKDHANQGCLVPLGSLDTLVESKEVEILAGPALCSRRVTKKSIEFALVDGHWFELLRGSDVVFQYGSESMRKRLYPSICTKCGTPLEGLFEECTVRSWTGTHWGAPGTVSPNMTLRAMKCPSCDHEQDPSERDRLLPFCASAAYKSPA